MSEAPGVFKSLSVWLADISKPLVARVMGSVGAGVITYKGIEFTLENVQGKIETAVSGIPADMMSIFSLSGFDQYITLVISGFASGMSAKALGSVIRRINFVPSAQF